MANIGQRADSFHRRVTVAGISHPDHEDTKSQRTHEEDRVITNHAKPGSPRREPTKAMNQAFR